MHEEKLQAALGTNKKVTDELLMQMWAYQGPNYNNVHIVGDNSRVWMQNLHKKHHAPPPVV